MYLVEDMLWAYTDTVCSFTSLLFYSYFRRCLPLQTDIIYLFIHSLTPYFRVFLQEIVQTKLIH